MSLTWLRAWVKQYVGTVRQKAGENPLRRARLVLEVTEDRELLSSVAVASVAHPSVAVASVATASVAHASVATPSVATPQVHTGGYAIGTTAVVSPPVASPAPAQTVPPVSPPVQATPQPVSIQPSVAQPSAAAATVVGTSVAHSPAPAVSPTATGTAITTLPKTSNSTTATPLPSPDWLVVVPQAQRSQIQQALATGQIPATVQDVLERQYLQTNPQSNRTVVAAGVTVPGSWSAPPQQFGGLTLTGAYITPNQQNAMESVLFPEKIVNGQVVPQSNWIYQIVQGSQGLVAIPQANLLDAMNHRESATQIGAVLSTNYWNWIAQHAADAVPTIPAGMPMAHVTADPALMTLLESQAVSIGGEDSPPSPPTSQASSSSPTAEALLNAPPRSLVAYDAAVVLVTPGLLAPATSTSLSTSTTSVTQSNVAQKVGDPTVPTDNATGSDYDITFDGDQIIVVMTKPVTSTTFKPGTTLQGGLDATVTETSNQNKLQSPPIRSTSGVTPASVPSSGVNTSGSSSSSLLSPPPSQLSPATGPKATTDTTPANPPAVPVDSPTDGATTSTVATTGNTQVVGTIRSPLVGATSIPPLPAAPQRSVTSPTTSVRTMQQQLIDSARKLGLKMDTAVAQLEDAVSPSAYFLVSYLNEAANTVVNQAVSGVIGQATLAAQVTTVVGNVAAGLLFRGLSQLPLSSADQQIAAESSRLSFIQADATVSAMEATGRAGIAGVTSVVRTIQNWWDSIVTALDSANYAQAGAMTGRGVVNAVSTVDGAVNGARTSASLVSTVAQQASTNLAAVRKLAATIDSSALDTPLPAGVPAPSAAGNSSNGTPAQFATVHRIVAANNSLRNINPGWNAIIPEIAEGSMFNCGPASVATDDWLKGNKNASAGAAPPVVVSAFKQSAAEIQAGRIPAPSVRAILDQYTDLAALEQKYGNKFQYVGSAANIEAVLAKGGIDSRAIIIGVTNDGSIGHAFNVKYYGSQTGLLFYDGQNATVSLTPGKVYTNGVTGQPMPLVKFWVLPTNFTLMP